MCGDNGFVVLMSWSGLDCATSSVIASSHVVGDHPFHFGETAVESAFSCCQDHAYVFQTPPLGCRICSYGLNKQGTQTVLHGTLAVRMHGGLWPGQLYGNDPSLHRVCSVLAVVLFTTFLIFQLRFCG